MIEKERKEKYEEALALLNAAAQLLGEATIGEEKGKCPSFPVIGIHYSLNNPGKMNVHLGEEELLKGHKVCRCVHDDVFDEVYYHEGNLKVFALVRKEV